MEFRLRRLDYLLWFVGLTVISMALAYATAMEGLPPSVYLALSLVIFAGSMVSAVGRPRDAGRSPAACLLLFVPLVNLGMVLYLFFAPSADT